MKNFSKERVILSGCLLFISLLISIFAVNRFINLHNYLELMAYLITPVGIVVFALSVYGKIEMQKKGSKSA